MHNLQAILSLTIISIIAIHYTSSFQSTENTEDALSSVSKSNDQSNALPLVLMDYFNNFKPPEKLEQFKWKERKKFFKADVNFSGSIPSAKQTFLCGLNYFKAENLNDQYSNFPLHFEKTDTLRCTKEPVPLVKKLAIRDSKGPKSIPCGYEKQGEWYHFLYRICIKKQPTENKQFQEGTFDLTSNAIRNHTEVEIYRFCYNETEKEVIYTKHELQLLHLLYDERLEEEREKNYTMITNGYEYFDSHFEKIAKKYLRWEVKGYKTQKLVPSNHFAFALWRKATYHYLNTMPIRKELGKLWDHILNRILQNSKQRNRQYVMLTKAFSSKKTLKPEEKIMKPDIWMTIIRYIEKINQEDVIFALSIVLNNRFKNKINSTTQFINRKYCEENLCQDAFLQSFPEISNSVHCCAINDNIKKLFEENLLVDRVLKPGFLFDTNDDDDDDDDEQIVVEDQTTLSKLGSLFGVFTEES